MADYKTFRCPNCGQFVNNTMTSCKFCSATFDEQILETSIAGQDRINDAYRAASNARILAGAMTLFFLLSFVPLISIVTTWVFRIIFLILPFFLIAWLIKYSGLDKSIPEIKDSRKYILTAFLIWIIYPVIYVVFVLLLILGLSAYELSK